VCRSVGPDSRPEYLQISMWENFHLAKSPLSGQVALGSNAANALTKPNSELGRGLRDRGRGCDKGAIRVAKSSSGR
jgi:hypothetical protein